MVRLNRAGKNATIFVTLLSILCAVAVVYIWRHFGAPPPWLWFADTASMPLRDLVFAGNVLPRLVMAEVVGAALGMAASLLQQLTRNPLAADNTLAVSSGAQIVLLAVTLFCPSLLLWRSDVWAFAGAVASMAAVMFLSYRGGFNLVRMILAGLIVNLYLGTVSMVLMIFFSEEARGVMQWSSGSLVQDGWQDVSSLFVRVATAAILALVAAKPLTLLNLGDEQAQSLGVPVKTIRTAGFLLAAAVIASVVSVVGMMGFVGLAAAATCRQLGVRTVRGQLLLSMLSGALLLLLTDCMVQIAELKTGWMLSTGAVTAFVGAPLLLWLIYRSLPKPMVQQYKDYAHVVPFKRQTMLVMALLAAAAIFASLWVSRDAAGWHGFIDWDTWLLRYPRLLMAAAAGMMLATAGVILQRMTLNPMASPELLGISAGTAAGVFIAVLFGVSQPLGLWLCGVTAAVLTLGLILLFNRRSGLQPERILLTGMAVAALFDALINLFLAAGDPRAQTVLVWLSGSTYQATPQAANALMAAALVLLALSLPLSRWLGVLSLNTALAQALGLNVALTQKILVVFAAVLTALATLMLGPMCFVGLWAPHLAKLLGFHKPLHQLLAAAVIAVIAMTFADWLGRQLIYPYEIPAGLMATLIGGAYFFRLMRKL